MSYFVGPIFASRNCICSGHKSMEYSETVKHKTHRKSLQIYGYLLRRVMCQYYLLQINLWCITVQIIKQLVPAVFPGFSGNYLHLDAGAHVQRKRARLLSPEVAPDQGPLCLVFYYQLQGEAQGSLRVLLRDNEQEEMLLWALKGDQGSHWREGRTILPQSPKEYQVSVSVEVLHLNLKSNKNIV